MTTAHMDITEGLVKLFYSMLCHWINIYCAELTSVVKFCVLFHASAFQA
jgi:hypothetical protein